MIITLLDIKASLHKYAFIVCFTSLIPNLLHLHSRLLRTNPNIPIKILCTLMAADFHNKLNWRTSKEFISTKRTATGMSSYPFTFRFYFINLFIALRVCMFNTLRYASQLADCFYMPIKFSICEWFIIFLKAVFQNIPSSLA
jgi:hypothetical protein